MTVAEESIRELQKNNEIVIDEIRRGEGGDADVFSVWTTETRLVFEGDDYSVSSGQAAGSYGIRCIRDGRLGFVTTNSGTPESLREAAREVQNISRLSLTSEFNVLAEKPEGVGHFESIDSKLQSLTPSELADYADLVIKAAQSDKRVMIDRAEMSWHHSYWALSSSKGFTQSAASTTCNWYVMGMAKQNSEVTSFDYDGGTVNKLADLESEILRTVTAFRDSVVGSLGPKKIKGYKGYVLLHPQAVMDLIVDFAEANCNGLRQQDGMSSWKGKTGEQVAHEALNIHEDPVNTGRIEGWQPFDREGVTTHFHKLIDRGVLNFVGHNCFTAKRAGVAPTGNASGGSRSLPGIGFSNLALSASPQSPVAKTDEEIFALADNTLLLKRFSGNAENTSGSFSGVAKNSHWIRGGNLDHPVSEVMVAGNLFDLLKNVVAVGKHSHHVHGGGLAPYLLVDGVSVTAS
jgi:PmbA protein